MRPVKIVTANLDFALRPEVVAKDLKNITPEAEIIAFQEGKRVNVDRLILNPEWNVFQKFGNDAKQGSGVAWRKGRIRARRRGLTLGVSPHGRGILTRYLAWVNLWIKDETGEEHPLTVVSLHLPPKRYWGFLYNLMLKSVVRFARARKKPIIFCADWNKLVRRADDLQKLAKTLNGTFYGFGIDGFLLLDRGVWEVVGTKRLPKNAPNGHHPVQIRLVPKR